MAQVPPWGWRGLTVHPQLESQARLLGGAKPSLGFPGLGPGVNAEPELRPGSTTFHLCGLRTSVSPMNDSRPNVTRLRDNGLKGCVTHFSSLAGTFQTRSKELLFTIAEMGGVDEAGEGPAQCGQPHNGTVAGLPSFPG